MSDTSQELFGHLSSELLLRLFDHLPVDVTFVDADDKVVYFSQPREGRAFPRTRSAIGRSVQRCHPPKSVHLVNQILDDFRAGKRETADFWINAGDKKLYIRYFPIRDEEGKYLGCLEVTQDIAEIQKLEGERRLLAEETEARA